MHTDERHLPRPVHAQGSPETLGGTGPTGELERRIGLSGGALRELVADLAPARPAIYWADLLASCTVAYGAFLIALSVPLGVPQEICLLLLASAATYRATLFTHELVHLPERGFRGFRVAWNLLCGIPLLLPSFLYEIHPLHHDRRSYGTPADGEYRRFASARMGEALGSVLAAPLAVPALIVRFLVLAPLGWAVPPLRRLVLSWASALVIDFSTPRPLPQKLPWHWLAQETACFLYCAGLLAMLLSGHLTAGAVLRGYLVLSLAITANALRVLCAHRYRGSGEPMTFVDQVLDSNNFPGGLSALWAPLGLRFHAVHHLFPGLPYHALGAAYRRLMQTVPPASEFRQTRRDSFVSALKDVLGSSRAAMRAVHES